MNVPCLIFFIALTAFALAHGQSLHDNRTTTIIEQQIASNKNCGDFRAFSKRRIEVDATWANPGIGSFVGNQSIDEYYQLVLPVGGGCGNAFGFQLVRLDSTPLPESITQVGPNSYEAYYHIDGYWNQLPPFDGSNWGVVSKGHLFKGFYNFTEDSDKLNFLITEDLGAEILYVGDVIASPGQNDPFQYCGLISIAQEIYQAREGYYPDNVTGFDLRSDAGFLDCLTYHTFLINKGDPCGTNLVDHTPGCHQRHLITYLSNGASKAHATHWAKLDHDPVKCLDTCLDVVANCSANAESIPSHRITETGKFEYYCICPVGYKGDALASGSGCTPVNCTKDADCKSSKGSYCDSGDNICKSLESYEWNRETGEAECPDFHKEWVNTTTGQFECIRTDKCWSTRECPQQPSRVSCQYPGNLASPYGVCLCNPGYDGGFHLSCDCLTGKNETTVAGGFKACLAPGECTLDSHCDGGETCSSDNFNVIGACQ